MASKNHRTATIGLTLQSLLAKSLDYNNYAIMAMLFYVSIDVNNSCLIKSNIGTIQRSILGPILYAIFVAPLFDLEKTIELCR